MELSIRLSKIVELFDKCDKTIDVGTDHGYIPIYLIKNNLCSFVIASDINKGPLDKAKQNILYEGFKDRIECRKGSGLSVVKSNEVNCAIIAGMGGNLIRDIILDDKEIFDKLEYSILQPVQNPEVLRKFLYEQGYAIIDEELCYEEDKYYEIIKVRHDNLKREDLKEIDKEMDYEISPLLCRKKHPLIKNFIEYKVNKYMDILSYIKEPSENASMRKSEIENKITQLKERLKCL